MPGGNSVTAAARRYTIAAAGALVLAATWVGALSSRVGAFEEGLFRPVNDLPDWIAGPAWPVMQFGALGFVPLAAAIALIVWRRRDLTVAVLAVGFGGWLISKVIKSIVERGRPADLLSDVNLRPDWGGLGYVSGHATIAFALATVISPYLNRTGRVLVFGAAGAAGLLRMYTGAHLPYDVVGGMGLGLLLGALARTVLPPELPSMLGSGARGAAQESVP